MADLSNNVYHAFQENFYYYQRNIRDYGDNLHEYNNNMAAYLTIMNSHIFSPTRERESRRITPPSRSLGFNALRNLFQIRDEGQTFTNTFEDVIVRPTITQITQATELILYDNSLPHPSCSITLETFQEGEQVCRIIGCGHIFKQTAIQRWFQRNVRCPVCRYDIREYTPVVSQREDDTEFDSVIEELNREQREENRREEPRPTPSTNLTSLLTGAIRNFMNNELSRIPPSTPFNELIYTFDIPIDLSNNRYFV